jgi:hypothetical protein
MLSVKRSAMLVAGRVISVAGPQYKALTALAAGAATTAGPPGHGSPSDVLSLSRRRASELGP